MSPRHISTIPKNSVCKTLVKGIPDRHARVLQLRGAEVAEALLVTHLAEAQGVEEAQGRQGADL